MKKPLPLPHLQHNLSQKSSKISTTAQKQLQHGRTRTAQQQQQFVGALRWWAIAKCGRSSFFAQPQMMESNNPTYIFSLRLYYTEYLLLAMVYILLKATRSCISQPRKNLICDIFNIMVHFFSPCCCCCASPTDGRPTTYTARRCCCCCNAETIISRTYSSTGISSSLTWRPMMIATNGAIFSSCPKNGGCSLASFLSWHSVTTTNSSSNQQTMPPPIVKTTTHWKRRKKMLRLCIESKKQRRPKREATWRALREVRHEQICFEFNRLTLSWSWVP